MSWSTLGLGAVVMLVGLLCMCISNIPKNKILKIILILPSIATFLIGRLIFWAGVGGLI